MGLAPLLTHPTFVAIFVLAFGGIGWVVRRRDPLPILPAITWLLLGLWSNPYLLPVRLPYAGYLDATTLASGAWLPVCILAGYSLARFATWAVSLGETYQGQRARAWRIAAGIAIGVATLVGGASVALPLSTMIDSKPYITPADAEALAWMRAHVPGDAYVLANPFAFPWDTPPQAIQGSDAGLWVPLMAGLRSSVPPTPAYNERLRDPAYLDNLREIIGYEPFADRDADWDALRARGITHIYVGSRGGALDVPRLLESDQVELVFHRDAAWVFELRSEE
jgi:hypothetical protein